MQLLCLDSSEAAPDIPQRGESAVKHHHLPPLPRPLLPRHLSLGEGQLPQELPLHPLRGLLRPGAGGGHPPEGRRLPLHGHRRRVQGGGHLLQAGEQRALPGRLPGLQSGAVSSARCGHSVATLTAANANANRSSWLAPNDRNDQEPCEEVWFAEHWTTWLGSQMTAFLFLHTAVYLQLVRPELLEWRDWEFLSWINASHSLHSTIVRWFANLSSLTHKDKHIVWVGGKKHQYQASCFHHLFFNRLDCALLWIYKPLILI